LTDPVINQTLGATGFLSEFICFLQYKNDETRLIFLTIGDSHVTVQYIFD
jgi:hypothetical protein